MAQTLRDINNQKNNWQGPLWLTEVDRDPFWRDCGLYEHHISIINYN
jgi:hypothetical protein